MLNLPPSVSKSLKVSAGFMLACGWGLATYAGFSPIDRWDRAQPQVHEPAAELEAPASPSCNSIRDRIWDKITGTQRYRVRWKVRSSGQESTANGLMFPSMEADEGWLTFSVVGTLRPAAAGQAPISWFSLGPDLAFVRWAGDREPQPIHKRDLPPGLPFMSIVDPWADAGLRSQ